MAEILVKLNEMMASFAPSEQKVARYISENLQNVLRLSVEELANRSGASKAAVIRFCKTIGYKGYRDLSIQLAAELALYQNDGSNEEYSDINVGDDVETILRSVSRHNVKAIEDTLLLCMDVDKIQRAVDLLEKAQRIDFYGVGASAIVALDAQSKFMRINKYATAYRESHLQLTSAVNLGETGVAVAISWSGETKDVVEAAKLAKESGASVIALTQYGTTTLSKYADIHFGLSAPEAAIRCGATSSRIAQLTMIDMLYYCLVTQNYSKYKVYLERSRTEVKEKKRSL